MLCAENIFPWGRNIKSTKAVVSKQKRAEAFTPFFHAVHFTTKSANTTNKENGKSKKTEIGFIPPPFEKAITINEYKTVNAENQTHDFFISDKNFIKNPFKIKLRIILT